MFEEGARAGEAEGAGAAGYLMLVLVICLIDAGRKF